MRLRFNPWVEKIPWSRKWQPTPVFLPGEFHGQRSLAGLQSMGSQRNQTQIRHNLVTKQQQIIFFFNGQEVFGAVAKNKLTHSVSLHQMQNSRWYLILQPFKEIKPHASGKVFLILSWHYERMTNEISLHVRKLPQVIQREWSHRHASNQCMSQITSSFYWFSCSVASFRPTLWDPMDSSQPESSVPGKNTGVGCHFHLQRIFPTLGSNLCLPCASCIAGRFFSTESPGSGW